MNKRSRHSNVWYVSINICYRNVRDLDFSAMNSEISKDTAPSESYLFYIAFMHATVERLNQSFSIEAFRNAFRSF